VAGPDLTPEIYAAFLRGIIQAVRRINADKRRYVSYFKQGWAAAAPDVQALTADDFHLGRIQLKEPTPIPEADARWAWDWMASWGVLHGTFDAAAQINRKLEREAHALAYAAAPR
jgi:NitT/TauT family transport system substrate-binding protein